MTQANNVAIESSQINSSGILQIAGGGTNSTATPTGGGVVYGNGTAYAITSAGTSGQYLQSAGTAAPIWATVAGNPTGTVLMWSTSSAPTGYLIANGSAVSRTTYSALFSVISTTFGSGDGSTTFNLPNFQGAMPIGVSGTYALAATGGSATTSLGVTNLPAHNHSVTINDPGHSHSLNGNTINNGNLNDGLSNTGNYRGPGGSINGNTTGISASTANTGSGTAFNTISPYLGIYFIIKT